MKSILQILKLHPTRAGIGRESQRPYSMQDCECLILDETGEVDQVGVLTLPKELTADVGGPNKVQPGVYLGAFALKPSMKDRKIGAVLVGLQPYSVGKPSAVKPAA